MSALKRLEVIEAIATDLQRRFVTSDVNVFLKGYGIEAKESSVQSKRLYVKDLLASVDNSLLASIAEELGIKYEGSLNAKGKNSARIEEGEESSIWQQNTFRLFISHLSVDKDKASALQKYLLPFGVSCFVAHEDVEPSTEWQIEIEKALNSMDALAAIITEDFIKSKWTDQEVGWALGRGLQIIPLNRGDNPYGFMGKYQALKTKGKKSSQVAEEILKVLRKNSNTKSKMEKCYAGAVVEKFIESYSYRSANENMLLLETVSELSSEQIQNIKTAMKTNSQLEGAGTVQERIEAFLEKFKK